MGVAKLTLLRRLNTSRRGLALYHLRPRHDVHAFLYSAWFELDVQSTRYSGFHLNTVEHRFLETGHLDNDSMNFDFKCGNSEVALTVGCNHLFESVAVLMTVT